MAVLPGQKRETDASLRKKFVNHYREGRRLAYNPSNKATLA
jgi:hypothetical protein